MSDHAGKKHILPLVAFHQVTLDAARIQLLVRMSRVIARWNGNQLGRHSINLITDDFVLARQVLTLGDRRQAERSLMSENLGLFWPTSGVMWIHPQSQRNGGHVYTLAHEVSHAIALGEHNRLWRRMYALLLPLWWHALQPNLRWSIVRIELYDVIRRYAAHRMTPVARMRELESHVAASKRTFTRWSKIIDDQLDQR